MMTLVGFGRACAHPSFWVHCQDKGALRAPPGHHSFAALPKIKNTPETKCFLSAPNLDRQGRISFHWAKLHTSELPPAPS